MDYAMHARRRRRFARTLGEGCLAIIPGATEVIRNGDVHYPFRQDSNFLYLTGFDEPDALLLIVGGKTSRTILFSLPKDDFAEMWTGERIGQEKARLHYGFDETHSTGEREAMEALIGRLMSECTMIAYPTNQKVFVDKYVTAHESQIGRNLPVVHAERILGEMRLIKDKAERAVMQRAGNISGLAHHNILHFVKPDIYEYEIEAQLSQLFRSAGGDPLHAYPMIVAGGKNACTLHYTKNNMRLRDGELLLIDAGCEFGGYASDITRTMPINGLWTPAQRALYEVVLKAQRKAILAAQVGMLVGQVNDTAHLHVAEGLLNLGLIDASDPWSAVSRGLVNEFFPHGTSHWLGLDVHDTGDYQRNEVTKRSNRRLEPGMVITVEPGLYIRPSPNIPSQYWNIGIRIEDDVLVTKSGPIVLSMLAPKDPDEIESIMQCGMV